MTYKIAVQSDVGQVRDTNEDSVGVHETDDWGLLVVADGMGGHAAGDVASEAAIEVFLESVTSELEDGIQSDPTDLLVDGVIEANGHLQELIEADKSLEGMGTTLVAALLEQNTATIVNVGDSRGYHISEETLEQVTVDQSLVQELVEEGNITPEEAKSHPQRNVVSQALGTDESVEPDTYTIDLEGWIILCSDGLTEEVSDSTIHDIVSDAADPETAAEALLQQANDNGGSDNISVAIGRKDT